MTSQPTSGYCLTRPGLANRAIGAGETLADATAAMSTGFTIRAYLKNNHNGPPLTRRVHDAELWQIQDLSEHMAAAITRTSSTVDTPD